MVSDLLSPKLLTVLSEGLRWLRGVVSSLGDGFWASKYAFSFPLVPDMTVSPESGGGDSALGNAVVTAALLARFS